MADVDRFTDQVGLADIRPDLGHVRPLITASSWNYLIGGASCR